MRDLKPFRIDVDQAVLDRVLDRVRDYQWHEAPEGLGLEDSWSYGANRNYMQRFCRYWLETYDWRQAEAGLNRFPQFTSEIDGQVVHFYLEEGSGLSPKPLIITHGWPTSPAEFIDIIEPLAHPERFGGDVADAFTVVVPSLPGFGFSGKPARPIGPRRIASLFDKLMCERLGLGGYIAQGGDFGAVVSSWMAHEGQGCDGLHVNMWTRGTVPTAPPQAQAEIDFADRITAEHASEGGYRLIQQTACQTLSYAMMDSPVGVAAWMIDKIHAWSDIRKGFEVVQPMETLLTNIMTYLLPRSVNTAAWLYRGRLDEMAQRPFPLDGRLDTPTAVAVFPYEPGPFPPRPQLERTYNLVRHTTFDAGGHFPARERPDDLIGDVRAFAAQLRG